MPIVQSFDGLTRRITLDASISNATWSPLDLFKEYLVHRRDNHAFRGFEPLIRMRGGEPKGGGKFAPRFLQMLTDSRGITTKLVLPDIGPYRTLVDGEIATDVADTDPEAFDVSGLTTAVIIDYKPAEAEIISVAGSGGLTAEQANKLSGILDLLEADEEYTATKAVKRRKGTSEILIEKDVSGGRVSNPPITLTETP